MGKVKKTTAFFSSRAGPRMTDRILLRLGEQNGVQSWPIEELSAKDLLKFAQTDFVGLAFVGFLSESGSPNK